MGLNEWHPHAFTAYYRGQPPGAPPVERWERVLRAERNLRFQLLLRIARYPRLRKLFGITESVCSPAATLAEREKRIGAIQATSLGAWVERGARHDFHPSPEAERAMNHPPPVGPCVDDEIDQALGLLQTMAFEEIQQRGWHFQPNHYYWPLNDLQFLRDNAQLWTEPKLPEGVTWNVDDQLELIRKLAPYSGELSDVRTGRRERLGEFVWGLNFDGLDAYAYYGLVRALQPSRVVEIGIGTSSALLARALARNERSCEVMLVDPRPRHDYHGELPSDWKVVQGLVQHVDLEIFSTLQAGDILFYDGSHCVRTGSDVNWLFFEVLPLLASGVWIHIHDISWPRDYSPEWIFDEGLSWNEQYLVQAFLMHNSEYAVRMSSVMLHHYKGDVLGEFLPPNIGGASSLWLEKVA